MPAKFISGLKLSKHFYEEAVRPILAKAFPDLQYATARLGAGSEILGFDDIVSTDHDWGPRLDLFLRPDDHALFAEQIHQTLANKLPYNFLGYSTHYSEPDANDNGTQQLAKIESGPINHRVTIQTGQQFIADQLNFDLAQPIEPADWLTFSQQRLLGITRGEVFHDDIQLELLRSRFAYYPHDVWLYMLAAGWTRIGQEEHLMGRAGSVGDQGGSALIGARLVHDIMRLCFLLEKRYAPYPKWIGTAFSQLSCASTFGPILQRALNAAQWKEREKELVMACKILAKWHNAIDLTPALPTNAISFFDRPFQVVAQHGFADALIAKIEDPVVQKIAAHTRIGSIDQFSNSTDLIDDPSLRLALKRLYQSSSI